MTSDTPHIRTTRRWWWLYVVIVTLSLVMLVLPVVAMHMKSWRMARLLNKADYLGPSERDNPQPWSSWLFQGDDTYNYIESMVFTGVTVNDQDLDDLAELPELTWLGLQDTLNTADILPQIRQLPALKSLAIAGARLNEKSIQPPAQLTLLEELWISRVDWEQATFASLLSQNQQLRSLGIAETSLQTDDIQAIRQCSDLQSLVLIEVRLPPNSLSYLFQIASLRNLSLNESNIASADLDQIAMLPNLEKLTLESTSVDDEVFRSLLACPALNHLDLRSTKVTASGVQKFITARPDCEVRSDFPVKKSAQP